MISRSCSIFVMWHNLFLELVVSSNEASRLMLHMLQVVDVFLDVGIPQSDPYSMIGCTKAMYAVCLQSMGRVRRFLCRNPSVEETFFFTYHWTRVYPSRDFVPFIKYVSIESIEELRILQYAK